MIEMLSNVFAAIGSGISYCLTRLKLKNSTEMQQSANSAAAQDNRDTGNAAVARVAAKVEPPAQVIADAQPDKKLTPEQIEELEKKSETDGSLDEIRRLSTGQ